MKNSIQIIVVEHADELTWRGIENIKLIERWRNEKPILRNDKALIPKEWF